MKRYMQCNSKSVPVMKIIVEVFDAEAKIAASDDFRELTHPSVKRRYKKSDEWLRQVNDLVRSIIGSMQGRNFKIIKAYPSSKSYTYYIRFQPTDKNGDLWDQVLEFQIELRDHTSKSHKDIGQVTENLLVKTYYLEDEQYKNAYLLMKEIWRVLDALKLGDFSSFLN